MITFLETVSLAFKAKEKANLILERNCITKTPVIYDRVYMKLFCTEIVSLYNILLSPHSIRPFLTEFVDFHIRAVKTESPKGYHFV